MRPTVANRNTARKRAKRWATLGCAECRLPRQRALTGTFRVLPRRWASQPERLEGVDGVSVALTERIYAFFQ